MKFTIYDLLWLTLVIAIPLGQWVWFRANMKERIRPADAAWEAETESARHATTAPAPPVRQSP
jgi:hypothetical protein